MIDYLKAVVRTFLEREQNEASKGAYTGTDWTLQGFGMLRAYMAGGKYRLHIWDDEFRVPNVTMIHDHPWDFDSLCVAGQVCNSRFVKVDPTDDGSWAQKMEQSIVCGPGGGVCDPPTPVLLKLSAFENLHAGETYTQRADEIHISEPANGSVTIIERTFHENTEVAHVYYDAEDGWVSAEPRPATTDEVDLILRRSLRVWFT